MIEKMRLSRDKLTLSLIDDVFESISKYFPIDDLDNISVVPNPYIVFSDFDQGVGNHNLRFTRLPLKCIITIYTINGELVRTIYHEETFDGNEVWDLKNEAGLEVAPGLYIYVVETDNATKIDKFAIIR